MELSFSDTEVPLDVPAPKDESPSVFEYACEECGVELHYGGRGRHPRFCETHKKGGKSAGNSPRSTKGNEALARQATAVLAQLNASICLGLYLPSVPFLGDNPAHLPLTASALAKANDPFEDAAYNALILDPKLCRIIVKAGGNSGKIALVMAYGMLGLAIVPVGIEEWKSKHDSRPEL